MEAKKMEVSIIALLCISTSVIAQTKEDAINSIFSNNGSYFDFLGNYEEVTPPPLRSIGALTRCGEGELKNRFVCVPYYNCNADTKTVQANPDIDGTNKIDIRMQDEEDPKCGHYLEVCCRLPESSVLEDDRDAGRGTPRPTSPPVVNPSTPPTGAGRANCGIRNAAGIDFNLIGGSNEANYGEFPWMLAILRQNRQGSQNLAICGASLIGPRVVLTGAHCVQNVSDSEIKVRAGEWDTQTDKERIPYQERNVVQRIVHEHFIRGNLYNDVALLILDRPFTKTDSIGTVCLPEQDQLFDSRECFATGWGKDVFGREGRYAVLLKKIQLPRVSHQSCERALRTTRLGNNFILHRSFTCAGGEPNVDTCTGDGGSPLVCPDPNNRGRYLQVGIVAWGINCGGNQIPGVYVNVAGFRTWIDTKLQEIGIKTDSYVN